MTRPLRVLYALRSWAHFTYHQSTIDALCHKGHHVTATFDPMWCEGYASDAPVQAFARTHPQFRHDVFTPRTGPSRVLVIGLRELRNYVHYLRLPGQSSFYRDRTLQRFPRVMRPILRARPARAMLAGDRAARLLADLEDSRRPTRASLERVRQEAPDVIVASPVNLWYTEEVEFVKAGKALGIPTVLAVLSWDNLTTKGVLHSDPDHVLAWNDVQRDEAARLHGILPESVAITGSPFFDKWFAPWTPTDPAAFRATVGLPRDAPFVVYLGSSANIAEDETDVVRALADALAPDGIHVLVRPHPGNAKVHEQLSHPRVLVWPKGGNLSESPESFQGFRDSVHRALCTVGLNTSAMIDAICADKPCVSIILDRYRSTQQDALHYQQLIEAGVLELASDPTKAAGIVRELAAGKDMLAAARAAFIRRFVRPHGHDGGEEQARVIERIATQKATP